MLPPIGLKRTELMTPFINVGSCLDIPTGRYYLGKYGEHILNGGLTNVLGVTGPGNSYKSELIEYMMRQMIRRFPHSTATPYDTEANKSPMRGLELYQAHPEWNGENIIDTGRWSVISSGDHLGCEWWDKTKEYLNDVKIKDAKKYTVTTPFLNSTGTELLTMIVPTGCTIDSLSKFRTKDVTKMQDDNELGSSGANTIWMRQGASKKRLLEEMTNICNASNHFCAMVAHIGEKIKIDPYAPNVVVLQHLGSDKALKEVPKDFTYLTLQMWHVFGTTVFQNRTTKAPEFPRNPEENQDAGSTDLNIMRLRMLRNKSGPSGFSLEILVSQSEGILDYLTEFYYVKTRKNYGIGGNDRNYFFELRPDVNLSRTTVRGKLKEDARLRRVANITAEMCQIQEFHPGAREYMMTPAQLFERIKELGYDWDRLLDTRGWWTYDNDKQEVPFLSTRDLLEMAHKRYVPYWMKDEELPEAVKDVPRTKLF